MTRVFTSRGWAALAAFATMAGAAATGALDRGPPVAVINETPSLPPGLYLRRPGAPLSRGAVVTVRQPQKARSYLSALGVPGDLRLLKRIAATGGDRVCARDGWILAPDRTVAVPMLVGADRAAPVWTECRRLGPDEVFVLGDTPNSFDSRYFGPVRHDAVEGIYQEVIRW